jgi:hypothetical protein
MKISELACARKWRRHVLLNGETADAGHHLSAQENEYW